MPRQAPLDPPLPRALAALRIECGVRFRRAPRGPALPGRFRGARALRSAWRQAAKGGGRRAAAAGGTRGGEGNGRGLFGARWLRAGPLVSWGKGEGEGEPEEENAGAVQEMVGMVQHPHLQPPRAVLSARPSGSDIHRWMGARRAARGVSD